MNNLEAIRTSRKPTYRGLSAAVGRVPSLVHRDCRVSVLTVEVAMRYADALGLTLNDIDPEMADMVRAHVGEGKRKV